MGFIDTLPKDKGSARETAILDAVKNNLAVVNFVSISSDYNGHHATLRVFDDALKIEGVRVNVSAATEQRIADHMGCLLMTAKIADLRYAQAGVVLSPHTRWDKSGGYLMSTTEWMIWHSQKIDEQLNKLGSPSGLKATVGKHWIIDDTLKVPKIHNQAINYGWHYRGTLSGVPADPTVSGLVGVHMIQSRGYHHDSSHCDYSQVCVLVARECVVDGVSKDMVDVLKDPELAGLISHSGASTVWRQPDVEDPGITFIV